MCAVSGFSPERSALRGLGSSAVVVAHTATLITVLGIVAFPESGKILAGLSELGWVGVALFLTLSIYLLMGSLDEKPDLKRYFKRRIVRIWPLYFATCIAIFVLADRNLEHLAWNVTFLAPINPAQSFALNWSWNTRGVWWTLEVEELAYLCFPLIRLLSHRRRVVAGWGLIALGAGLMMSPLNGPVFYFTPWPWLVCYGFGLLAYERALPGLSRWGPWAILLVPVALGVPALRWPLGLILIGPVIAWVIAYPPKWLRRKTLVAVGESSYALYLTHGFFLNYLGPIGAVVAYPAAFGFEAVQRGRQMLRRIRAT